MERRGGGSGGLERGELGEVVTDEQGNQIVFRKIEVIRIFKFLCYFRTILNFLHTRTNSNDYFV